MGSGAQYDEPIAFEGSVEIELEGGDVVVVPIEQVAVRSHDGRVLGKGDLIWSLPEDVVRD